jgi:hypothetical protein
VHCHPLRACLEDPQTRGSVVANEACRLVICGSSTHQATAARVAQDRPAYSSRR